MLISLNDILNNGYIPGLWPREELEAHLSTMKNEAKMAGIPDTPENIFDFFIEKIK
jgi:dynein heavy chain